MRDRYVIVAALLVFLVIVSAPAWYAKASRLTARGPEPKLPTNEKACVAPTEYMRTSHMDLLITWRTLAVRDNVRTWQAADGRRYTISLTGTCLKCHDNKAEFCDRCHTYAGVAPTCWDCHVDPGQARGRTP